MARKPKDKSFMRALGHPTRCDILRTIAQKDECISPARISEEINESVGNVGYHVLVLKECDALDLVDTRQVRGATEHFYAVTSKLRNTPWAWGALGHDT